MHNMEYGVERQAFAALIVADSDTRAADAMSAVELAGGRVAARVGWPQALDRVAQQAGRVLLILEAIGVDAAMLDATLPQIEASAAALGCPVIATLDEDQIDVVAAGLSNENSDLLCHPTVGERAAALAVAAGLLNGAPLHDTVRENEAARLAALNQEVARIAQVLDRLSRRDQPAIGGLARGDVADRRQGFEARPGAPQPIDADAIRRAIRARRMRDQIVGAGLFEDPAWDMLLDLFAAHLERAQVSVSSLCIAAAVAPTTALRWIGKLTANGLIERHPDPFDRRRVFMALSNDALEKMRSYVGAVQGAGLSVV